MFRPVQTVHCLGILCLNASDVLDEENVDDPDEEFWITHVSTIWTLIEFQMLDMIYKWVP